MYQTKQRLNARSVSSEYTEHLFLLLSLCKGKLTIYRQDGVMIVQTNALETTQASSTTFKALLPFGDQNNISSKFQQSRPFPPPFVNSCHQYLNLHFIYKIFVQDTLLHSCNKNVIMAPAQGPPHMNSERPRCLSLHNTQLLYQRLMRLCTPIILVINITTKRKIVNYFRKTFHYRCLTGS